MAKATDKGGAAGTDPAPDTVARLTGAAAPPDPVPESELDTLRRERAELVRERDEMRHRAEVAESVADRLAVAAPVVAAPPPPRPKAPAVVHGAGDCLWAGRVPKDPLAPRVAFRTPTESVGDAKDAYLRHAGILATEHPVEVTRADG